MNVIECLRMTVIQSNGKNGPIQTGRRNSLSTSFSTKRGEQLIYKEIYIADLDNGQVMWILLSREAPHDLRHASKNQDM